jgi:type II restriction enzyme
MTSALAAAYHSGAQRARVVTEAWARSQLYCANCDSSSLGETPANNRAIDFVCPRCRAPFQLKAKHSALGETVTDGAYTAMVAAIREDRTPNLLLMRYALATWEVRDLLLIPSFMFSESAVIKRKPLAATARRAGWVGCNIDLHRIAPEARIPIIAASSATDPAQVRARYTRLKPIREIKTSQRGWTLDVLNIVRRLGKTEFSTTDAYAFTRELEKLHPDNRHVRDKIRQQLQVLRDAGLLLHIDRGVWRLP